MSDEKDLPEPQMDGTESANNEEVPRRNDAETNDTGVEVDADPIKSSEDDEISIETLRNELEAATEKANDCMDKYVRAQADMENLRRRTEKELQNAHKFALDQFSKELLPVVDSLELGIQAAADDSPEVTKFREGNELTLQLMKSVLEKFNIVAIDPEGDIFNPELHQAMAMEPAEDKEPNTVLKVFQKGYSLNDRLIRPAMVVVAQANNPSKVDEQA